MSATFRLTDSTLRDGSHAVAHQYTLSQVTSIVAGLDAAGVPVIEVSHGDGLGGSSFNYGFSGTDEMKLITRAVETAKQARIACLLIPGIGTAEDLRAIHDAGACTRRSFSPRRRPSSSSSPPNHELGTGLPRGGTQREVRPPGRA
jgi:4-hydroxy 2-oxovalerate aldolase